MNSQPQRLVNLIEEDFIAVNHGSIIMLTPVSDLAKSWVHDHLDEDAMWHGRSVVIEPRYWHAIWQGIRNDGLTFNEPA